MMPMNTQMAPGQGRPLVGYRNAGAAMGGYPAPVERMPVNMMDAISRRLALNSQTGDQTQQERDITGKDSLGRSRPNQITMAKPQGPSNYVKPVDPFKKQGVR